MIAFACAHCGMKFKVKDEFASRSTKCPTCKLPLTVPSVDATQAFIPSQTLGGVASQIAQAGIDGGITLGADFAARSGQIPVRDLLGGRTKKTERYLVDQELARGGMGAVMRAVDCDIRREVAVKYLLNQDNPHSKTRFVEEAQITGQLEHPNIVPIHELGMDGNGRLFFTMKMVKGRSLSQVLDELRQSPQSADKDWPLGRLLNIFVSACNALAYAHSRGVVHRDLKPANLMIGDFGEVYVMDWGLAKVLQDPIAAPVAAPVAVPVVAQNAKSDEFAQFMEQQAAAGRAIPAAPAQPAPPPMAIPVLASDSGPLSCARVSTSREDTDLTQEGAVMGTPVYMPPEQALGKIQEIDQRSDVYSLGAILYEMLTLQPPIDKEGGYTSVLMRVTQGQIQPPEERSPERLRAGKIPRELSAIALKALAKEPKDRYQTVEGLRQDIERFQEGRSVSAKEDSKRELIWKFIKRNKGFSAATAGALLVLLVVVWLFTAANYRARLRAEEANAAMVQEQNAKREQGKKSAPLFLASAQRSENAKDFDYALAQVEVALEYDPELAPARLLKSQLLIGRKEPAKARAELGRYLKYKPKDEDARFLWKLCKEGQVDDPGTLTLVVDILAQQKAFGVAEYLLRSRQDIVEARQQLAALYRQRIDATWPGLGNRLSTDGDGHCILNFADLPAASKKPLTDLSPLAGMRLNSLSLSNCDMPVDLSPLKGMPLSSLTLSSCRVRDWEQLRGLPLTSLYLSHCSDLANLEPLRGMPLTSLQLPMTCRKIEDLSPLQGMKLTLLDLNNAAQLRDVAPLRGMPLTRLDLVHTVVADLTPLEGMKLEHLNMPNVVPKGMDKLQQMQSLKSLSWYGVADVSDLSALKGLSLTTLSIANFERLSDLSALRGMPLVTLQIHSCGRLTNLKPLEGMSLTTLNLNGCAAVRDLAHLPKLTALGLNGCTAVRDLAPLKGTKLNTLDLSSCDQIRDLTPLRDMPLISFDLPGCSEISDLTPLQGMPLNRLYLPRCPKVKDLAPLRGMKLTILGIDDCGVTDLTPLHDMELVTLSFSPKTVTRGLDGIRRMTSLQTIGPNNSQQLPAAEFWKRYDAGEFHK
jgi:serine/threonine protein kinase